MLNFSLEAYYKKAILISTLLHGLATIFLLSRTMNHWLPGLWGTFFWMGLNGALVVLLENVLAKNPSGKSKGRLLIICLFKFVLLYAVGFYALWMSLISVEAVFCSLTLYIVALVGTLSFSVQKARSLG